eukprot:11743225-Alexandrium_andersonii.AAC.1
MTTTSWSSARRTLLTPLRARRPGARGRCPAPPSRRPPAAARMRGSRRSFARAASSGSPLHRQPQPHQLPVAARPRGPGPAS